MEIKKENDIKLNKLIGEGSEAVVYSVNNNEAYKKFFYDTPDYILKNKQKKLHLLNEKNIEGFIKPEQLVYDMQGFRGYTMARTNSDITALDILLDEEKSLKNKIETLKKIELLMNNAHNKDVLLIDLNMKNFIVDNNDIKGIDIDNFMIGEYQNDLIPSATYYYYLNKISKEIDPNMDKFAFAINSLMLLSNEYIVSWHLYKKNYDKFDELLEKLDLPNNFKNFYYELLNSKNDNMCLSEVLDEISSEDSFIKEK